MNWSWVNETAYDDEGMRHLIERVVQASHQMHASDPYEDHEPTDIQSVLVVYSSSGEMKVQYRQPDLHVSMPVPTKLWADLEAVSVLTGPDEVTVPREVMEELASLTLSNITNTMAVFRSMLKLYTAAMKANDDTAWQRDITAPCQITIHKEAM